MRTTLAIGIIALAAAPLAAQNVRVRATQQVDGASFQPAVPTCTSSDGELSAILWRDAANGVYVALSDGRGVVWQTAQQIDNDISGSGKFITEVGAVIVVGSRVYAQWDDSRNDPNPFTESEVFFNRYVGGAWQTDKEINKGFPAQSGHDVMRNRMAASAGAPGGNDYVYILISTEDTPVAMGGTGNEDLWLAYSNDSGANFTTVRVPQTTLQFAADVDEIAIAAEGNTAYIVWQDDRNGSFRDDIWFQRVTIDGGGNANFLASDLQIDGPAGLSGEDADDPPAVACCGSNVLVTWMQEATGTGPEEVRAAISTNGGTSFSADVLVGNYTAGTDDVDGLVASINGNGYLVAWDDDRQGIVKPVTSFIRDDIFVAQSTDGINWTESALTSAADGGNFATFGNAKCDAKHAALAWTSDREDGGLGFVLNDVEASFSGDDGATWSPLFQVDDDAISSGDADFATMGYNGRYNNYVVGWLDDGLLFGSNAVFSGGFRPQTLQAVNWIAGQTGARFQFHNYTPNTRNPFGLVLLSSTGPARGSFLLTDGRDTGLTFDLLTLSGFQFLGFFFGAINASGFGQTPQLGLGSNLQGITIYAVGAGLTAAFTVNQMSDVCSVTIQ